MELSKPRKRASAGSFVMAACIGALNSQRSRAKCIHNYNPYSSSSYCSSFCYQYTEQKHESRSAMENSVTNLDNDEEGEKDRREREREESQRDGDADGALLRCKFRAAEESKR